MFRSKIFLFFLCINFLVLHADEGFNPEWETPTLQNIRQLTFPSMGFEKAGEAYFSPDSKSILFQAVPKGQKNYQIYFMDINEGIPRLVSTGKGACTCAFFRPDGKKIIFASSHEDPNLEDPNHELNTPGYKRNGAQYSWEFTPYMNIYESNLDGSQLKALTRGETYHAECAYSPDGSRIVFASNENGSMNLYTMKSDGTDVQQITFTDDCYNGGPFYSPDGQQILFRADRERAHYLQLYLIGANGENEIQLTDNEDVNWAPFWHPCGKIIAYTTSRHGHRNYEIYLMHIFTCHQYRVTYHPCFDGIPVFNKTGNKIMWTSKRGLDQTCQIFIADFNMPKELLNLLLNSS